MEEVPIINEEVLEFGFGDFSVLYNVTQGLWLIDYYIEGTETEEVLTSEEDIPEGLDFSPEDFDRIKSYVQKLLEERS